MKRFILPFVFLILVLASCNTTINVDTKKNLSSSFNFETSVTESVESVLKAFFGAGANGESLFDGEEIKSSLQVAQFTVTDMQYPSETSLYLEATTPNLCTAIPGADEFIVHSSEKGISTLAINLTPENIRKVVALLPAETAMYIDLLIAPVFTGEAMTKADYVDLISIAYGETMAEDLKNAFVTFEFSVPGKITKATLSNQYMGNIYARDKTIKTEIPLLNLLTDLSGTSCVINWKE